MVAQIQQQDESFDQVKKSLKCTKCEKSYTYDYKLRLHMKSAHSLNNSSTMPDTKAEIHESHKNHKCESCGKSFSEAGKLKKHIQMVHEGQKIGNHENHKCKYCDDSFSKAGSLKKHAIHQGHKDYKCGNHFLTQLT